MNLFLLHILTGVQKGAMPFLYFFITILSAFVIAMITIIVLIKQKEKRYNEDLKRKFSANKTFVIDFKEQRVEYFSFRDLKQVHRISYTDFLKMFVPKEQNKLSNWLTDIVHQKDLLTVENSIFITDLLLKENVRSFSSRILFTVTCVDKTNSKIYLNSVLLTNLPSEYNKIKKGIFKKDVFLESEVTRFYSHGLFSKGTMYIIDCYKKENTNPRINEYAFRYIIVNAIYRKKNALNFYVLFNEENPLEFTILDTRLTNEYQVGKEVKGMIKSIKEVLEIQGYSNYYEFTVVGAKTTELDNDFQKAHETLSNVSKLVRDSEKESLVYKNENNETKNVEESYKAEVNKIIKMQSIHYSYSPLIKIANKRVLTQGYIATVTPKGSFFDSIDEVKKSAEKYSLDKELFSMIARKVIPTFNNEKENNTLKLLFPITLNEIPYVLRSFSHMNLATNTKIAVVINNNEFVDEETNQDIINNIKNLQSKDYEVYVKIKAGDYNLRSTTYSLFNGFLIDTKAPESSSKYDNRDFLIARSMLDKLVKYKEPIISYNAQSWSEIEILVKSGVYLFSSQVIAQSAPMLVPVDKKVQRKLLNMYKK